jgi:hypothetical protein
VFSDGQCASGSYVSGGGIDQAIGSGMSSNGNHVNGSEPSSNGSAEYQGTAGSVGTNVAYWLGVGGSGGMTNASYSSTAYAMCFANSVVTGNDVIMNKISGEGLVVATCPSGEKLLGGGGRATPASVGSMKIIGSYPTYSSGYDGGLKAAKNNDLNPDSWAAYSNNGGGTGTLETYAYAICGTGSGSGFNAAGTKVHFQEQSGPTVATTGQASTVGCASGETLLSGGAAIAGSDVTANDFTLPGSQGDHLNGTYPSDGSGTPVSNNTTTAQYWTASTHTGGQSSPSTVTDAWALCGTNM